MARSFVSSLLEMKQDWMVAIPYVIPINRKQVLGSFRPMKNVAIAEPRVALIARIIILNDYISSLPLGTFRAYSSW